MEFHQLRYFCAVATYGTFTRAAKAEHVTQPSLSQQILKLEEELGGKLFDRQPRNARLTPLGEFFLPHALAILQAIRESKAGARQVILAAQSQAKGNVTLIADSGRSGERSTLLAEVGLRTMRKGA